MANETHHTLVAERSRLADYWTLTKPELTLLSVITTITGYYLGAGDGMRASVLLHTLLGTWLVGGGAGALNQFIERQFDGMMRRTENRPLPSGRVLPSEALIFGILISVVGLLQLTVFVNPLTGFLASVTLASYLFLYTPLKRITPLSTVIGAIPGAIPPLMGWVAATNEINTEGVILFGVLFAWQVPHFLALAWMYRKDYARAGYRPLTVVDPSGLKAARQMVLYTALLIPLAAASWRTGMLGTVPLALALLISLAFLALVGRLLIDRSNKAARQVFTGSLIYLPVLMALLILNRL
jgi:protoheme IX farnesyltransferase